MVTSKQYTMDLWVWAITAILIMFTCFMMCDWWQSENYVPKQTKKKSSTASTAKYSKGSQMKQSAKASQGKKMSDEGGIGAGGGGPPSWALSRGRKLGLWRRLNQTKQPTVQPTMAPSTTAPPEDNDDDTIVDLDAQMSA